MLADSTFIFFLSAGLYKWSSAKLSESTDLFPFERYFFEQLTSLFKKRQRKSDNMPAMRRKKTQL